MLWDDVLSRAASARTTADSLKPAFEILIPFNALYDFSHLAFHMEFVKYFAAVVLFSYFGYHFDFGQDVFG